MAEFYKLNIGDWNVGTDALSLEQEAAYLRIVSAIMLYEQPIRNNLRVLSGLWRCNERKAKRLLDELIDAGKVEVEGDLILNRRAMKEASTIRRTRVDKQSTGRRGGIESGKARRNLRENNETAEAGGLTREEKRREEKKDTLDTVVSNAAAAVAPSAERVEIVDPAKVAFDAGVALLGQSGISPRAARELVGKWRKSAGDEAVIAALGRAKREGAIDPVAFIEGALRFAAKRAHERTPEIGDRKTFPNGRTVIWRGAVDQWVEIRE